ncbi:MAG: type IV pilin [Halosimplex sp.]
MELKTLFTDDRGVSPVVGVVILIAITVVLAAVVAGVVLGLGSNTGQTPSASFEFTNTTSGVQVAHAGGDELNETNIKLTVNGGSANGNFTGYSTVSAGTTRQINNVDSGDTIRIIWMDPSSDKTAVLAKYKV